MLSQHFQKSCIYFRISSKHKSALTQHSAEDFTGSFKAQMHANGILPCKNKMKSYLRLAWDKCHCSRRVSSTRRGVAPILRHGFQQSRSVYPTSLQSIFTDIGPNLMFNLEKTVDAFFPFLYEHFIAMHETK